MTIVMMVIISNEGDDYKRLYKSRVETYIFSNKSGEGSSQETLKGEKEESLQPNPSISLMQ